MGINPQIKEMVRKSEEGFEQLLEILDKEKYPRARRYIERLSEHVTTFFDIWLSKGECIPLNTNIVESAFSKVKNRIWSIGKRWREEGLMNWHIYYCKSLCSDTDIATYVSFSN